MNKKTSGLLIFAVLLSAAVFAQKTPLQFKNRLTVSTNLYRLAINEVGADVDYFFKNMFGVGINVSAVYMNPRYRVNVLSPDQGVFPGTVWHGLAARLNYKIYFSRNKRTYYSWQFTYKNLFYRNENFMNYVDGYEYRFNRSEDAMIYGVDMMIGHHFTSPSSRINVEIFGGAGIRFRNRNYTTFTSSGHPLSPYTKPLGNFEENDAYPSIVVGLKVGYNNFFGKKAG